jgi:hypothetical protein
MGIYGCWLQAYFGLCKNKKSRNQCDFGILICDLDWIQTSNLLSRNQMRYSVAPRGHLAFGLSVIDDLIAGANIVINAYIASVNP